MKFPSTAKGLGKLMDPVPSNPQCEGTVFTCEPVLGQLCMTQFSRYPLHPRVQNGTGEECVRVCVGWGEGREVKLGEGSGGCNCFSQLTHSTQSERIIYGLYGVVFTASTCK